MSSASVHEGRDGVLRAVDRVRMGLVSIAWGRAAICAIGAAFVTWIVSTLVWRAVGDASSTATATRLVFTLFDSAFVAMLVWWLLARRYGRVTRVRAALWIEEQRGSGFALVTWIEQVDAQQVPSAMLQRDVARVSHEALASAQRCLRAAATKQLRGPLLFVVGALAVLGYQRGSDGGVREGHGGSGSLLAARERRRDVSFAAWRVRVTPPAYSGRVPENLGDVTSLRALSGSRIDVEGIDAAPDSIRVRILRDSQPPTPSPMIATSANGWRATVHAVDAPMEVRVLRTSHTRLLLIEGVADSIPQVTLTSPARDSVLRRAEGGLTLRAHAHDDIGIVNASFEVVVSSGEGEKFTVRTERVGARTFSGQHDGDLSTSLDLTAMKLAPGDIVHIRAVARDGHPVTDHEAGASETRSFRIARPSDYDSVAVEPAPPPEVDKSLLSQRMLLLLTERLETKRPGLATNVWHDEAFKLARDQSRLREAVGDAVFQRLQGDRPDKAPPADGRGGDAGKLNVNGVDATATLDEGDDSPVIAINKPLLEAYNAMWDASRALEQANLRGAIPHMKLALAAIERARAASRLYLRGRPPIVIVDIAKVRMVGKDTGAPVARRARVALPPRSALRESRLLAIAEMVQSNPLAARDSLALLRLESLSDAPTFAESLNALVTALSTSGTRDLTEPFLRARRALGGIDRASASAWSRGGPP